MRLTYYKENENADYDVVSISAAKKLLKDKGGFAWTEHYDRDGGLFETTPIKLSGNNSRFKYNRHL